jgi:membrane protein implicated in regulation of membrane protease activity
MTAALLWMLVGIVLIITELLVTGIVAVFFGIAAIITGLLLQFGLIETLAMQYASFGIISVATLVLARKRMTHWFRGNTKDKTEQSPSFQQDIGERATVINDFQHGCGRVTLNGVSWTASSAEELKAGEPVWVISNEGIRLTVSRERPTN